MKSRWLVQNRALRTLMRTDVWDGPSADAVLVIALLGSADLDGTILGDPDSEAFARSLGMKREDVVASLGRLEGRWVERFVGGVKFIPGPGGIDLMVLMREDYRREKAAERQRRWRERQREGYVSLTSEEE